MKAPLYQGKEQGEDRWGFTKKYMSEMVESMEVARWMAERMDEIELADWSIMETHGVEGRT